MDVQEIKKAPIKVDLSLSNDRKTYIPIDKERIFEAFLGLLLGSIVGSAIFHFDNIINGELLLLVLKIVLSFAVGVILVLVFFPASKWITGSILVDYKDQTLHIKKYYYSEPTIVKWEDLKSDPPTRDAWDLVIIILNAGSTDTSSE